MSKDELKRNNDETEADRTDITAKSENDSSNNDNKNGGKGISKGIFITIAVLALAVIGLVAFIIGDKTGKKKDDKKDVKTEASTEITTEKAGNDKTEVTEKTASDGSTDTTESSKDEKTEDTTEKIDDSKNNPLLSSKSPIYIKLDNASYWGNDKSYTCQYNVNVINNSGEAVEGWEVVFEGFADDCKLGDNWCGSYELKNGKLSVKPADFNSKIDDKNEINFGFQMIFTSEAGAKKATKNVKLFIGGKEYDPSAVDKDDKTEDTGKEDKTTEAPEADKEGKNTSQTDVTATEDTVKDDASTEEDKKADDKDGSTPVGIHGKLSVNGVDIVDKDGKKFQLKGVSTHGLAWFPDYVNKDAFKSIRDDWGANLIRLAMYTDESGGYCTDGDKNKLKELVKSGVDYATDLGMYVIIDWHILHDLTPMKYKDEAIAFFEEMSALYKDYDNVLFEICNEPNGGTSWSEVKEYAEEVIPVIRKNCPDAIIIVGTPTWSQDADIASKDQIEGYDNIMYAVHFYAATHKDDLRNKVKTARSNGAPVFISEFSICDASGNGAIDYDSAEEWMKLLNDENISYATWNLSNKNESSSLISSDCNKTSGWSEDEMSETGAWLREQLQK